MKKFMNFLKKILLILIYILVVVILLGICKWIYSLFHSE